jgi:hypothetical protein
MQMDIAFSKDILNYSEVQKFIYIYLCTLVIFSVGCNKSKSPKSAEAINRKLAAPFIVTIADRLADCRY